MEKFIVRWNNGLWKTFNTETYTDIEVFLLKKDAENRLVEVAKRKG